jgi:hypothetical protein
MKIRYQPLRNTPEIEIRDLRGHKHGTWRAGEEQDIGTDEKTSFTEPDGTVVVKSLIDALFSCGPEFVDDATGKNPLFVCSSCGEHVDSDFIIDRATLEPIYLREDPKDEFSPKLCMADFLATHPEHGPRFKTAGLPSSVFAEATKRAGARVPEVSQEPPAVIEATAPSIPITSPSYTVDGQHSDDEGHE